MQNIPSIGEVRAALLTLQQFLDGMIQIHSVFNPNNDTTNPDAPDVTAVRSLLYGKTRRPSKRNGKSTWKSKVVGILTESDSPLSPSQISDEFALRYSWKEKRSKLGNRVRSTLALMKRDGLVNAQEGRYSLSKQHSLM